MLEISLKGRVLQLALNRPEKRNALNAELCRELVRTLAHAEDDPAVGAILIKGNGPGFCAGMDLREALDTDLDQLAEVHELLFTTIERIHKPVIAAVHGSALAGGTGLACNAHIVVASPDARFGLTEIRIGLWPVMVIRACVLAMGERRTTELSLTGRVFSAEEAQQYGLVTEVAEDPQARALELAAMVSEYSLAVLRAGLDFTRQIRHQSWPDAGRLGRAVRAALMAHPDFTEGATAFLEKRRPVWSHAIIEK